MKLLTLISHLTISLAMLSLSTQAAIADKTPEAPNDTYSEKRRASAFWDDFNLDEDQSWPDEKAAFRDGWIEGKLAAALALNHHLHMFNFSVRVENAMATLGGGVYSDVEKELAEQIALGIEGIDKVTNNIHFMEKPAKTAEPIAPASRTFAQYVADVSTTAAIKTELRTSKDIDGSSIIVETLNRIVTLSGEVRTLEHKALAQAIAAKHNDVKGVINNLNVKF